MKNKFQAVILFIVIFTSCTTDEKVQQIEFNGFKNLNSSYKVFITIREGKGRNSIISDETVSEFETELSVSSIDSMQYNFEILRLKYEHSKNALYRYVFDTDLDTVSIASDYMELAFDEEEKKKTEAALNVSKQIKGKSIHTSLDNVGNVILKKNEIDTKDFFIDSYYNPEPIIEQIFKPAEFLKLFDFVFYPETGAFEAGKAYKSMVENDSITIVYEQAYNNNEVQYAESRFNTTSYKNIDSRINIKTGSLLLSKYIERVKKDRDALGMYSITEKEVVVQRVN